MTNPITYDIVINGGGMVGALLAGLLGGGDYRVAVLESRLPGPLRADDEVDLRVSAVSPASQRVFQAVGAWDAMAGVRVSPYREMRVWDATGQGRIHFDATAVGQDQLGWIVENRLIQGALLDRALDFDNIQLLCPATLADLAVRPDRVDLTLGSGRHLSTRLLVGADGARSRVRELAGIPARGWDYSQKAVVCTVTTEQPHEATAWQRFLPTGPLAFLPLADGRCSIVWSTTHDRADALLALSDDEFARELGAAFDHRLGAILGVGRRGAFPLRLQHALAYTRPRVALIGDAAHVAHPLAGQGANLGFMDAAALAQVLAEDRPADPGQFRGLRRYERWRKGENMLMLGVLDGFKRLFGNGIGPLAWLRNTGLNLFDAAEPVKHQLIRRATGLSGDLPRLARRQSL